MTHFGWNYIRYDPEEAKSDLNRELLGRVWRYGRQYRRQLVGVIFTVVTTSILSVVPPQLTRRLIDEALPQRNLRLLTILGLGMVLLPLVNSAIGVLQRWWSARAGEGIIFDLRRQLYEHLQKMSLALLHLNPDRRADLAAQHRCRRRPAGNHRHLHHRVLQPRFGGGDLGGDAPRRVAADLARVDGAAALRASGETCRPNSPALHRPANATKRGDVGDSPGDVQYLGCVAGQALWSRDELSPGVTRPRLPRARDLGVKQAMVGRWFFATLGLVGAFGSAVVFWVGGWMVIREELTIGTVVMFTALIGQLYGPLSSLTTSRVELATSLVSFERVFEVLDMRPDVSEGTEDLREMKGDVEFDHVSFRYQSGELIGLEAVKRRGRRANLDEGLVPQQVSTRQWAIEDVDFKINAGQLVALGRPERRRQDDGVIFDPPSL